MARAQLTFGIDFASKSEAIWLFVGDLQTRRLCLNLHQDRVTSSAAADGERNHGRSWLEGRELIEERLRDLLKITKQLRDVVARS